MDATIIAALISASASIITAFLGNRKASEDKENGAKLAKIPQRLLKRNMTIWLLTLIALFLLSFLAALFIHYDLGTLVAIFGLLVVCFFLSYFYSIKPYFALSLTFLFFPFGLAAEPLAKLSKGYSYSTGYFYFSNYNLSFLIPYMLVIGAVVWYINSKRIRILKTRNNNTKVNVPAQLSTLAQLHKEGTLTDAEFARAKEKLLL